MTVTAVIQARMGSTRLQGKVLRPLLGRTVLEWCIRAAQESKVADTIVVATSDQPDDDAVVALCEKVEIPVVRGSESDVLSRFLVAVNAFPADTIVRLCGDAPFTDPAVISHTVGAFHAANGTLDYLSTMLIPTLPQGTDVEVFTPDALRDVDTIAKDYHRSHVTSAIYLTPDRYRVAGLDFSPNARHVRLVMDYPEDAEAIEIVAEMIGDRTPSWRELVKIVNENPAVAALNANVRQKDITEG